MLRWDIVILLLVLLSSSHILNTQYLPTNPLFHNFRQKSFRGRTIRWEYKSWDIKKHLAKKSKWCGATFVAAFTMLLCWDSAVTLPTETLVANYLYALLIFQNNNYIYALLICHNNNNAWHPEPKSTLIIFRREESKSATTTKTKYKFDWTGKKWKSLYMLIVFPQRFSLKHLLILSWMLFQYIFKKIKYFNSNNVLEVQRTENQDDKCWSKKCAKELQLWLCQHLSPTLFSLWWLC